MTLLRVEALSEDSLAAPGNRNVNYIALSVTDNTGGAINGLNIVNVQVAPILIGPTSGPVTVIGVLAAPLGGFHLVEIVPHGTETWKAGTYIFGVTVNFNGARGQALCSVVMD